MINLILNYNSSGITGESLATGLGFLILILIGIFCIPVDWNDGNYR